MDATVTVDKVRSRVINLKKQRLQETKPDRREDWENLFNAALLDDCIAGFLLLDDNFVVQKINAIYARFLERNTSFDIAHALGRSYFELSPGSASSSEPWFRHIISTGTGNTRYNCELRTQRDLRGGVTYQHEHLTPLVDNRGNVVGSTMCCIDVTESVLAKTHGDKQPAVGEFEDIRMYLTAAIRHLDQYRQECEGNLAEELCRRFRPDLDRLKRTELSHQQRSYVRAIEVSLADVMSKTQQGDTPARTDRTAREFVSRLAREPRDDAAAMRAGSFTPTELRIAELVVKGKSSKEIAFVLGVSKRSVDFHRYNIRRKLNLTERKANLSSHLMRAGREM